jgi:hypothetical protein
VGARPLIRAPEQAPAEFTRILAPSDAIEIVPVAQKQTVLTAALFLACFAVAVEGAPGLWLDVPYIHQEKDGCGSASLAMILRYWQSKNVSVAEGRADPVRIQRELYAARPRGIYASDMERYLRASGFDVYALRGEWGDLRLQVAKGRPLIAGLKPKGGPAHLSSPSIRFSTAGVISSSRWEHDIWLCHVSGLVGGDLGP